MSLLDNDNILMERTDIEKLANIGYPTQEQKDKLLKMYPHGARYINITELEKICSDPRWPYKLKYENPEWFKEADCLIQKINPFWKNFHVKGLVIAIAYKNIKIKREDSKCKNYGFGWTLKVGILYGLYEMDLNDITISRKNFDPSYNTYSEALDKSFELFKYFKIHPDKIADLYKLQAGIIKNKIKTPLKSIDELVYTLSTL